MPRNVGDLRVQHEVGEWLGALPHPSVPQPAGGRQPRAGGADGAQGPATRRMTLQDAVTLSDDGLRVVPATFAGRDLGI